MSAVDLSLSNLTISDKPIIDSIDHLNSLDLSNYIPVSLSKNSNISNSNTSINTSTIPIRTSESNISPIKSTTVITDISSKTQIIAPQVTASPPSNTITNVQTNTLPSNSINTASNDSTPSKTGRRLQMNHGFIKYIQRNSNEIKKSEDIRLQEIKLKHEELENYRINKAKIDNNNVVEKLNSNNTPKKESLDLVVSDRWGHDGYESLSNAEYMKSNYTSIRITSKKPTTNKNPYKKLISTSLNASYTNKTDALTK